MPDLTASETLDILSKLSYDKLESFYKGLKESGLDEKELEIVKSAVFFHKMENNPGFYNAVLKDVYDRYTKGEN